MKFASFIGCQIPARVSQYADATEAVFKRLDVELIEFSDFNCCGYPVRNINHHAFLLSAAKNLAVAESAGLDLVAMCKCCYGTLKKAEYLLGRDEQLKKDINAALEKEKLHELFYEFNHLDESNNFELFENAKKVILDLESRHEIFFITARSKIYEDLTKEIFDEVKDTPLLIPILVFYRMYEIGEKREEELKDIWKKTWEPHIGISRL